MGAQATAQLNVRMNKTLRDEGTRALKQRGYTPAMVVRAVWEKAARRGQDLDELVQFVEGEWSAHKDASHAGVQEEAHEDEAPRCRAHELWRELMENVGLDPDSVMATHEELSYDEMLEEALEEKYGSSGLASYEQSA